MPLFLYRCANKGENVHSERPRVYSVFWKSAVAPEILGFSRRKDPFFAVGPTPRTASRAGSAATGKNSTLRR